MEDAEINKLADDRKATAEVVESLKNQIADQVRCLKSFAEEIENYAVRTSFSDGPLSSFTSRREWHAAPLTWSQIPSKEEVAETVLALRKELDKLEWLDGRLNVFAESRVL